MNTRKIIAVCLISGAALAISHSSSAQIRLGAVSTTHLTSAASLNTPSVSNALRASSAVAAGSASRVKTTGAATADKTVQTTATTEKKTVAGTRRIEAKTTTAVSNAKDDAKGTVSVHSTNSA